MSRQRGPCKPLILWDDVARQYSVWCRPCGFEAHGPLQLMRHYTRVHLEDCTHSAISIADDDGQARCLNCGRITPWQTTP